MTDTLLISGFQVQVLSGSPKPLPLQHEDGAPELAGASVFSPNGRTMTTIVTWAFAPDWLTPGQAAQLLGLGYDEAGILALIDQTAIVAEENPAGGWLVEKRGLREFQEALWEVLSDGD